MITISGGLSLLLNWYFLFSAYSKTSIGIATTVYNTQPFILVALCAVFFKEKVTRNTWLWLVVSFVGLVLISFEKTHSNGVDMTYLLGIIEALLAAALYAVASIVAKILKQSPSMLIAFFQMFTGIALFYKYADFSVLQDILAIPAIATVTLGVLHTGVMYILLYGAIQKLNADKIASISFLYPAIAIFVDDAFFHITLSV